MRIQIAAVCRKCKSQHVSGTANVSWDKDKGDWAMCSLHAWIHDETWCDNCEDSCDIDYIDEEVA